ncbi:MAG: hypothetical protein F6K25_01015 [Okeania sp. SIO2G4]|uniref:hypothetical protein n=1 Tax=unclassified Okeania TaxID=2634635 RepID=UPI0013BC0703|nr:MULTISPECIES: hypothetical protein [unclassified Okeania]NEP05227.1 hypothetical protein [Okeania sp. SIO4D6]NEP40474.1 hypothetical protein [Okeania sp. SIO2H7]NEP71051.1 hypothetical protein [Okeania sp. SIO2G5]NEP91529.1 hypothetical protein [Okeania sp. SIO2F5]NEQ89405.1 hypothetical protein [Okeania sp. SIO2G4]
MTHPDLIRALDKCFFLGWNCSPPGSAHSHFDTFIFDLDGVIIDSEYLSRYAFCEAYHRVVGEGEPPLEEYWQHLGDSFRSTKLTQTYPYRNCMSFGASFLSHRRPLTAVCNLSSRAGLKSLGTQATYSHSFLG